MDVRRRFGWGIARGPQKVIKVFDSVFAFERIGTSHIAGIGGSKAPFFDVFGKLPQGLETSVVDSNFFEALLKSRRERPEAKEAEARYPQVYMRIVLSPVRRYIKYSATVRATRDAAVEARSRFFKGAFCSIGPINCVISLAAGRPRMLAKHRFERRGRQFSRTRALFAEGGKRFHPCQKL